MVVDAESLLKVEAILKRKVGQPKVSTSCANDTDHVFTSVNALLKYENAKRSKIVSLSFTARKDGDWTKQARLSLSSSEFRTLEIEVMGSQETAPRVRDELAIAMERSKAWYWFLYKIDFFYLLGSAVLGLWIAGNVILRIQKQSLTLEGSGRSDDALGLLILLFLFGSATLIHFLRGLIFPRLVFLIGQEIGRYNTLDKIQWGVIVSFLVSVAASIVSLFLPESG